MSQTGTNVPEEKGKKKLGLAGFRVPHVYVLLFMMMIVVAILSYILPAGEFARVADPTGRMVIDPASFTIVERNPTGIFDIFLAIPIGMRRGVDVIFMVVLTLAGMEIIISTGALQKGLMYLMKTMRGREYLFLIGTMIVFFGIGGFVGWAQGILMFVPLAVAIAISMKYDALVGLGITTIAAGAGFATAPTNIYNVGVAHGILGLPLFSALEFRLVTFFILMIPTIWYVLRYANKVKNNPDESYIAGVNLNISIDLEKAEDDPINMRHILIVLTLISGFAFAIYGTLNWGWFMVEIAAMFTLVGVVGGLIGGKKLDDIAKAYAKGAEGIISNGLTIGIAVGILVLMEDAKIIDTIIYYLASFVVALPTFLTAIGMFVVQIVLNTFIPSASGQAITSVPILGPVSEIAGSTQQVAVLAYMYGDGFTNMIIPTSATVWATLAIAGGIPYEKWLKFATPIVGIWIAFGAVFLVVANLMKLGPF